MGGPKHVNPPVSDKEVDEMDKKDIDVGKEEAPAETPKEEAKVIPITESVSTPPTEAEGKE